MEDYIDAAVVFGDEKSKRTKNMIEISEKNYQLR